VVDWLQRTGKDDSGMYDKFNEKSELERFRNKHSELELDRFEERYRGVWEVFFVYNHEVREVPLHPWKVLKRARADYAELLNDGDWPSMPMRHALRVVKDEYAERWRELQDGQGT